MDEEQLRRLISSLSLLSRTGDIPLDAFTVLASAASTEKLADQLHQRWLSDHSFARIAALVILHLRNADETELALTSTCLVHLLSDYRSRYEIKRENRQMFRNSVRALAELYPVYKQIDIVVSECLIVPLFESLEMLIDNNSDEGDIQAVAGILLDHGSMLMQLRPDECENMVMQARKHLCDGDLTSHTRRLLLHVIDLWTYSWHPEMIPDCILKFYENLDKEKKEEENVKRKTSLVHKQKSHESVV